MKKWAVIQGFILILLLPFPTVHAQSRCAVAVVAVEQSSFSEGASLMVSALENELLQRNYVVATRTKDQLDAIIREQQWQSSGWFTKVVQMGLLQGVCRLIFVRVTFEESYHPAYGQILIRREEGRMTVTGILDVYSVQTGTKSFGTMGSATVLTVEREWLGNILIKDTQLPRSQARLIATQKLAVQFIAWMTNSIVIH